MKIFGFHKTVDEHIYEGGSFLILKLLNLAIVLSLTNMLLTAISSRQLGYIIGERRLQEARPNDELVEKVEIYRSGWLWWHYTKVYIGFFMRSVLPITIILLSFTWYPLTEITVPGTVMVLALLIVLVVSSLDGFASAYKAIGFLSQIMIGALYTLYFGLQDMLNDQVEKDDKEG
jgi:hypothetical protein